MSKLDNDGKRVANIYMELLKCEWSNFRCLLKNISRLSNKAIYIHCFCHSLNLAVQDRSMKLSFVRDALSTIQELSNLIKYSG